MKYNKKILCLFITFVILYITMTTPTTAFTKEDKAASVGVITKSEVAAYQEVIDKLNKEYGYSMSFVPELFTKSNKFESPTKMTLSDFESQLRADIEADIAVNKEAKAAINALGNVKWENLEYLGKSYKLPVNVSYKSAQMVDTIVDDDMSFKVDYPKTVKSTQSTQTISSIQPKLDPTENVAFLLTSTISIPSVWRYYSVDSFSYMLIDNDGSRYIPTSASYSFIDSYRTVAVTFTCKYYNNNGVLVNSNATVYREFYAAGDCLTNWPNYTIPKTYTNKTYNHISNFDDSQNCAGYAWNYKKFVDMDELGITWSELNNCASLSSLLSLVKSKSEIYMSNNGISATVINSYNTPIYPSTQYRVVLRVGYNDANGNGKWDFSPNPGYDEWDYHWWMQLGDKTWADKRGSFPSRIIPNSNNIENPANIFWTMYRFGEVEYSNFYNSTPVYYKITE